MMPDPHPPAQVLLPPSQLRELAVLVAEDLLAFAETGGYQPPDSSPQLVAYRHALQLVLSLRRAQWDSEMNGLSMTAHALLMEDERDWLMILVERLRSVGRMALEDLESGTIRPITRSLLRQVLS